MHHYSWSGLDPDMTNLRDICENENSYTKVITIKFTVKVALISLQLARLLSCPHNFPTVLWTLGLLTIDSLSPNLACTTV